MNPNEAPASVPERPWPLRWWDAGVLVTLVAMALIGGREAWFGGRPAAHELVLALGVLVLVGAWYLGLGRAALSRANADLPLRPIDTLFVVVLILLIGAATCVVASYATLQTIGYPIVWTIARRYRDAVRWSIGLAAAVCAGFSGLGGDFANAGGAWAAVLVSLISLVFAVAMGTWITGIHAQGERYRELAEALGDSQREVAALSEAAGAATERERLSRDLHDTLTQTLAGLVMLSEQADRALAAGDPERARDRLERVRSAALESVREARALVATTQPLGDGGLEAALERTAARLTADTGLRVHCSIALPGDHALDREQQVMLLRAAQEGLANARKHARAAEVWVSLRADGAAVELRVEDDGVGPARASDGARPDLGAGGYGLTGLADRFGGAGGAVRFARSDRGGALLEARLPVESPRAPEAVAQTAPRVPNAREGVR